MSATTSINRFVSAAASQIGYYRRPGSRTKFGEWYGLPTGQWCAMFVSWAAAQSDLLGVIPRHAYTPSGVNWFKAQGQWHAGRSGIRRGDIAYFDFPGAPNRVSHVAIVESVNSDGSINTIEGNTSGPTGDQRNGGACMWKRRKSYIVGFGRPNYRASIAARDYLYKGDQGAAVRDLQKALIAAGHDVGPSGADGVYGNDAENAVRAFQEEKGLDVDGVYGKQTRAALTPTPTTPVKSEPKHSRPDCTRLQRAVRTTADNVWGDITDKHFNALREASNWGGNDFPFGVVFAQKVVGTKKDGIWGKNSSAAHDSTVVAVQAALKSMGYDPGPVDGLWGPSTEAAYQSARRACRV